MHGVKGGVKLDVARGVATGAICLHPQHIAVGGGRRCRAGDAAEEERRARHRRVVRAEEQNRLAVGQRAESQDSSSRSHFCVGLSDLLSFRRNH